MKRARFALLAAVIGLAACGGPAIPPAQNYATISAADGTYKIENFPIGPNEVQVTPPAGYTAVQSQYTISPQKGETLKIDIALKKNP